MTGCDARNVMSGTAKYALVQKTRGNPFVADAADQNLTPSDSELYLRRYVLDQL